MLYFGLVGVGTLTAFSNWRLAMLLILFVGALQDPVRKLTPGAPGWMVLAFTPILLAICATVFPESRHSWPEFTRAYPRLGRSLKLLVASLFLAGLVLLVNYGLGAWKVGVIGLLGYVFPLLAILIGFLYVRSIIDLQRFILVYCLVTAILLIGGLLEHWQVFPEWPAIGTEVLDMYWIRHVPGYIVKLTSGFYRSPDLLGWHAGLLVMFSLIMTLQGKGPATQVFWLGLAVWGTVILLLSGRNKMIFMPPICVATGVLAYMYKGNVSKALTIVVAGSLSLGLFLMLNKQLDFEREYFDYVGVGTQTASSRVGMHGLGAIIETYRQSGFFGEGLGSASTGARYGGGNIKTWQESGPSKLMVELGVPGFIAAILLGLAVVRALFACLNRMPVGASGGIFFVGLLGIVAANAASFLVSHQAYGDPFLVTLAGFLLGLTLSAPRWAFAPAGRKQGA